MDHNKYFNLLYKVAEAVEPVGKTRLAACLVQRNTLVSIGTNKMKTHPFQRQFAKNDCAIYLHAEIDCIVNSLRHLDQDELCKCTMYVLRVKHCEHGLTRGMAKPCSGCQRALAQFNVKRVYYTLDGNGYDYL